MKCERVDEMWGVGGCPEFLSSDIADGGGIKEALLGLLLLSHGPFNVLAGDETLRYLCRCRHIQF